MSAGGFSLFKYQLDDTSLVVPVNLQPETLGFTSGGVANTEPADDVNLSIRAKARKGNREYGIGCRLVTIAWDAGQAPAGYDERATLQVPILQPSVFDGYVSGAAATYLGGSCQIVGKKREMLR